jgi:hypothetical protein
VLPMESTYSKRLLFYVYYEHCHKVLTIKNHYNSIIFCLKNALLTFSELPAIRLYFYLKDVLFHSPQIVVPSWDCNWAGFEPLNIGFRVDCSTTALTDNTNVCLHFSLKIDSFLWLHIVVPRHSSQRTFSWLFRLHLKTLYSRKIYFR